MFNLVSSIYQLMYPVDNGRDTAVAVRGRGMGPRWVTPVEVRPISRALSNPPPPPPPPGNSQLIYKDHISKETTKCLLGDNRAIFVFSYDMILLHNSHHVVIIACMCLCFCVRARLCAVLSCVHVRMYGYAWDGEGRDGEGRDGEGRDLGKPRRIRIFSELCSGSFFTYYFFFLLYFLISRISSPVQYNVIIPHLMHFLSRLI